MADDVDNSKQAQLIDDNLKRVYNDMLTEEVPDRFLNLLDQLKQQDQAKSSSDEGSDK